MKKNLETSILPLPTKKTSVKQNFVPKILTVNFPLEKNQDLYQSNKENRRLYALYPNPHLYEVHAVTFDSLTVTQAGEALKTELPTIFPGNFSDYAIDIRVEKLNDGRVRAVAIAILRNKLDRLRTIAPKTPLLIPIAHALLLEMRGEISIKRNEFTDSFNLEEDTALLKRTETDTPFEPDEIDKLNKMLFFYDRETTKEKKTARRLFLIATIALLFFIGTTIGNQLLKHRLDQLTIQKKDQMEITKEIKTLKKELENQKNAFLFIQSLTPPSPYPLLEGLEQTLPKETLIETLSVRGEIFTIRGTTPNSLKLIENLEQSDFFDDTKLTSSVADDKISKEHFSLTGRFYGR